MKGFSYESGSQERVCLLEGLVPVHKRAGPELSAMSCTVSGVKGARVVPRMRGAVFRRNLGGTTDSFRPIEGRGEFLFCRI